MTQRTTELLFFTLLLALANTPLLCGHVCERLLFVPERVAAGEWWRLLTASFVHHAEAGAGSRRSGRPRGVRRTFRRGP